MDLFCVTGDPKKSHCRNRGGKLTEQRLFSPLVPPSRMALTQLVHGFDKLQLPISPSAALRPTDTIRRRAKLCLGESHKLRPTVARPNDVVCESPRSVHGTRVGDAWSQTIQVVEKDHWFASEVQRENGDGHGFGPEFGVRHLIRHLIVPNYKQFGGINPYTASIRNVAAQLGATAPHTNKPFSEAMILGVGGGIGAGYMMIDYKVISAMVMIGTRHLWHSDNVKFMRRICTRIGLKSEVKETTGKKAAQSNLRRPIEEGRPALAWLDLASIPYASLPEEYRRSFYHLVVVIGLDDTNEIAYLDDRAPAPTAVSQAKLAEARAAIRTYKNRIMVAEQSDEPVNLRSAVEAGIGDCYEGLLNPRIKTFGLESLTQWAKLVANPNDKRGWPKTFEDPTELYKTLAWVHHWIETGGTGGGALRGMYADFLDEAAIILDKPGLGGVAQRYRESSRLWSALAVAALPDSIPLFRETRDLNLRKRDLFHQQGCTALPEIEEINRRLLAIESEVPKSSQLSASETTGLLTDLRDHVLGVYAVEKEAANKLQDLVP